MRKNFLKIFIVVLLVLSMTFDKSFALNNDNINKSEKFVLSKDDVYYIRNSKTNSSLIFNGEGKIILKTVNYDAEDIGVIEDKKTNKVNYIYKTYKSEQVDDVEYKNDDGTSYVEKIPSVRTVFYDKYGNEIGLNVKGVYGSFFALNDYIAYYVNIVPNEASKLRIFDAKNKKEIIPLHDNIDFYNDKIIISSNEWDDNDNVKETLIYDSDFNLIKTINGYSYIGTSKFGKKEIARLMKKRNDKEKEQGINKYNYLNEKFDLVFNSAVNTNLYENDTEIVKIVKNDIEFLYDFENYKKVSDDKVHDPMEDAKFNSIYDEIYKATKSQILSFNKDYNYVEVANYKNKIVYFASYDSTDENNEYVSKTDVYDENLIKHDVGNITDIYSDVGYFVVDRSIFYDFDFNIVKKFDNKAVFYTVTFGNKKYLADAYDGDYSQKEKFNLYDTDFNIIFKDIKSVDYYTTKPYLLIDDGISTKVYNENFEMYKDIKRRVDIYTNSYNCYEMYDKVSERYGILDKNFNILIEGVYNIYDLKKDYFTFVNGFKYGFMDYNGNVIISFSIFDSFNESAFSKNEYFE